MNEWGQENQGLPVARLCSAAAVVSEDKRVDKRVDEKRGLERAIVVGRGIIICTTGVDDIPIDCRFFGFKGSDRNQPRW
jgi:hypothetical protein